MILWCFSSAIFFFKTRTNELCQSQTGKYTRHVYHKIIFKSLPISFFSNIKKSFSRSTGFDKSIFHFSSNFLIRITTNATLGSSGLDAKLSLIKSRSLTRILIKFFFLRETFFKPILHLQLKPVILLLASNLE